MLMCHITSLEPLFKSIHQREREGFEAGEVKGRAEMIARSLPKLRDAGLCDEQLIETLGLSAEEIERLLRS